MPDFLFERAVVGLLVVAPDLGILRANAAFESMADRPAADLVGSALREVVQPFERPRVADGSDWLSSLVRRWSGLARVRQRHGGAVVVHLTLDPVRGDDGELQCLLAQCQRVEHAGGSEEMLRSLRERLAATHGFLQVAGQLGRFGAWRCEAGSGALVLSREARLLLRLPPSGAVDRAAALQVFAPPERVRLAAAIDAALEEGRPFDLQAPVGDGSDIRVRITGEPGWGADGGVLNVQGAIQDISEIWHLQDRLLESQRALQSLVANLNGMAYRCDNAPNWPFSFVSEGATAITGYTPRQLMAQAPSFGDLIHADDRRRLWDEVQAALARKAPFQLTYRVHAAGGELRWVWEQGRGVFGADGRLRCLEGFVTDITEAERSKQEIRRLNDTLESRVRQRTAQLQQANRELEAFGYHLAHDLRAPLAAVAGFAQALGEHLNSPDDKSAHYLRRIQDNAARMQELTEALLALARLSSVQLRRESVDVSALAWEILEGLQEAEPQRRTGIEVEPRLSASGDAALLRQVLANLIGNAWKFSRHCPVTRIRVRAAGTEDGATVFVVADEGAGFDGSCAEALFEPFRRWHDQDEFEGTGIGLAIVRKIVQLHGGRVWAESAPGAGAAFYFTLGAPGR